MELKVFDQKDGKYNVENISDFYEDLVYATKSDKNKLDLYIPKNKKKTYPLLAFIHSGGFFKSDKNRHLSNILNGLLFDYAVCSINFRLNDETNYQGSREDIIDALNYLSNKDFIDSNNIILWGESYGSYVALDIEVNHRNQLNFNPKGIIDMYCATDLYDFHQHKIDHHQELIVRGKENDFYTFGDHLEGIQESKFLGKFTGEECPILILHGKEDEIIPIKYSYALEEELKNKGNQYEAYYIEGVGHGIDNYAIPEYNKIVFDFIVKQIL